MFFFIQPALLAFQCFYTFFSFLIYIVTMMLIQKDRETFKGAFFLIYRISFFLNVTSYLVSFVVTRFPHHTCEECWFNIFYTDETFLVPITICAWLDLAMKILQFAIISLYILNRYFALLSIGLYDTTWSTTIPITFVVIFIASFVGTRHVVLKGVHFNYTNTTDCFMLNDQLTASMNEPLNLVIGGCLCLNIAVGLVSLVQGGVIEGITNEGRTLPFCLVVSQVIVTLVAFAVQTSYVFNPSASVLWTRYTDIRWDILTCSQPWILLLCSQSIRTKLLEVITPFTWNFSPRTPDSDETVESDEEGIPLQEMSRESSVVPRVSTPDVVDAAAVAADGADVSIKTPNAKTEEPEQPEQSEEPTEESKLAVSTAI